MKIPLNAITNVVDHLLRLEAVKATKYLSPKDIVRAVRTRFGGKIRGTGNIEISLTIGKPNYLEREFIKDCLKAKEPFPVKKIQLKLFSPRKTSRNKVTQ